MQPPWGARVAKIITLLAISAVVVAMAALQQGA
jgi:hypothetical protein